LGFYQETDEWRFKGALGNYSFVYACTFYYWSSFLQTAEKPAKIQDGRNGFNER